jgi:ribosome biogenesis GTPase A
MAEKIIQWFPGHMAKTMRQIREKLPLVDIVIEVLDARAPFSTVNPSLEELIGSKPLLYVLNKSDMSDPKYNEIFLKELNNKHKTVLLDSLNGKKNIKIIEDAVNEVLKAIKNFNVQPGSQTEIDLTALLNTINANGADLSSRLSDIYGILKTLNANVIKNNNDNLTFFTKILAAMPKNIDSPDFSAILAKLNEILAAIKNHTVDLKITVDGHFTICDKDGNVVHEGEMDNLDWILG